MKKELFITALLFAGCVLKAQVGINTPNPDPNSDLTLASVNKGLLLNRVALASTSEATPLSVHTEGMTVYNTATVGDVTPGVYFNDGSKWIKSLSKSEPWKIQNTTTEAGNNTENIYQQGKVSIGSTSSTPVTTKQLEVVGDFKTQATVEGLSYGIDTSAGPSTSKFNSMYTADNEDWLTANKFNAVALNKDVTLIMSQEGTTSSQLSLTSNAAAGIGLAQYTGTSLNYTSGFSTNTLDGVALLHTKRVTPTQDGSSSQLYVKQASGISFIFNNTSGAKEGGYVFPRNNGSSGQILVTDGNSAGPSSDAHLTWKNASEVMILKSPGGNCFKLTVNDAGVTSTAAVTCP